MATKKTSTTSNVSNPQLEDQVCPKRIVIVQAGFVFVGEYHIDKEANCVRLTDASNIAEYGTTLGIGQLAVRGVQPTTVLHYAGVVDIPITSVVCTLLCNPETWA